MRHLAIFTPESVKLIFSGKKKIDGRFSKIKIPPYGKVSVGDVVLMKVSGEDIVGQFTVDKVFCFDHPNADDLEMITKRYGRLMAIPDIFWNSHEKVNFVTLMFIGQVTKFLVAPEVTKHDLRPWMVLE